MFGVSKAPAQRDIEDRVFDIRVDSRAVDSVSRLAFRRGNSETGISGVERKSEVRDFDNVC